MTVDKAMDVAHVFRRMRGTTHCHEPDCSGCAAIALATEVTRQQSEIRQLRKLLESFEDDVHRLKREAAGLGSVTGQPLRKVGNVADPNLEKCPVAEDQPGILTVLSKQQSTRVAP